MRQLLLEDVKHKHRVDVMDIQTFKKKLSFTLSGSQLLVGGGVTIVCLITFTWCMVAFTPLREFIPGYANDDMVEKTFRNAIVIDSLEHQLLCQEWMIKNIQDVVSGKEMPSAEDAKKLSDSIAALGVSTTAYTRSRSDSLLRIYVEQADGKDCMKPRKNEDVPNVPTVVDESQPSAAPSHVLGVNTSQQFVNSLQKPINGVVVSEFSMQQHHFGIDIAAPTGTPVTAVATGTVIFSNYTSETGYVIVMQHAGGIISAYKHCSSLLKKQGDVVYAGDAVGYIGNSGYLSTGPHLHFELWVSGAPVDPLRYVSF